MDIHERGIVMAGGFTEEQREQIRKSLLASGYDLFVAEGFRKMTVAGVAGRSGVAVGTFYNFFPSKEQFVIAMIRDTEAEFERKMQSAFFSGGTISLQAFMKRYREFYYPENNLLLKATLDDWVWIKSHIKDSDYLNKENDLKKVQYLLSRIKGIRTDADPGVMVNSVKMIYALYQNRDTLFEESLQTNVDLIFESLYRYMKG